MEIVTEPDIRTAEQARRYAEELQLLLRTIGASDADMERGQMRVEANVSLRPRGTEPFGTRVEVKNMNSFRSVERAIAFEIERQAAALDAGEPLIQETRGWADDRGETYRMRIKETSDDYRYFPEPDLPPLRVDAAWLAAIRAALPELPAARRARYRDGLGLSAYDAAVLVARPGRDGAVRGDARAPTRRSRPSPSRTGSPASTCASARRDPEAGRAGRPGRARRRSSARSPTARSLGHERQARCSRPTPRPARRSPRSSRRAGFRQISDAGALGDASSTRSLAANPAAVADFRAGKAQAIGFLVGQVMKATRGQANAALVQAAVRERLAATAEEPDRWASSTSCCGSPASRSIAVGYRRATGPVGALPGAQGAGREHRALRVLAGRPARRRHRPAPRSRWRCCAGRPRSPRRSPSPGFVLVFLGFLIR